MSKFYKSSTTNLWVVGNTASVPLGSCILTITGTRVEIKTLQGECILPRIEITSVQKEDSSYYATVAELQTVGLDFFFSASIGGASTKLRIDQSSTGVVEEDGIVNFSISIYDIDEGAIVLADIDIASISAVLQKSTGGAAFSASGITQPTFTKTDGLVSCDYRFLAAQWINGDIYKLVVSGITADVDGDTAHVKLLTWSNTIQENANVEAKIDTIDTVVDAIQTDIGDPSVRTNLKTLLALLGNPDAAGKTIYGNIGDFVGQTNLKTLLAALGIPDTAAKPLYTCLVTDRLDQATYGLSALQVLIAALQTDLDNGTDGLGALKSLIDGLNNISTAQVNTEVDSALNTIIPASPTAGSINDSLSKAAGGNTFDKSTDSLEAIRDRIDTLQETQPKIVERATAVLPASTNTAYFTVSGRVLITEIIGEVTIIFDGTANSIKLINTTTVGADVDMCTALVVTSDAVGTRYNLTGDPTDAMVETTSGPSIAQAQAMIVPDGTIDLHTTATDTTGSTKWTIHYIPLDSGSTIVVA